MVYTLLVLYAARWEGCDFATKTIYTCCFQSPIHTLVLCEIPVISPTLFAKDPAALKESLFAHFFSKADLEAAIALTSEQYVWWFCMDLPQTCPLSASDFGNMFAGSFWTYAISFSRK